MDGPSPLARPVQYALSLKQPWAVLLAHGLKTIEVRRWPTARRGPVLIHAAKVSDERREAWSQVPVELMERARLVGGIVGAGEITDCLAYRALAAFQADQPRHLNVPSWFEGPVLYGFTFINLKPLAFRPYPGWMRFFPVQEDSGMAG
jgi:ASCH domain